jgi:hypothetical protein
VFVIILQMAALGFVAVSADSTFATTGLQWEGFTCIAWRALCAVGYTTPPFYEGVEYEELGVPSCRVRVTVLPHPCHPEWADLSMELLCFRAAEAVESAALMVLHTLSTHRPQEMLQTPLGLVPALDPNDPLWLGWIANIATLLETVPPYDTVQTLGTCLRALYALQDLRRVIADDLAGRLIRAAWYIY